MPIVKNKRAGALGPDDVYVGRPTKWGNPFTHLTNSSQAQYIVESREEAIEAYKEWLLGQPELLEQIKDLRGKNLVCWCAPKACHAEILLELANSPCPKCHGAGWCWGTELDDADEDTYSDTMTHYTCDWCEGTGIDSDII
jgi:hypothetical protein